jgi:hypothetical protein
MTRSYRYVKFPEIWWTVLKARPTTEADWRIALALLEKAKFSPEVKFSNEAAAKLGLSHDTKRRSLARLGSWGLIDYQSRQGSSPMVRVKWLAGRQPSDG